MSALPTGERVRIMQISKAADLYLGELARQGKSPRTVARYRRQLDRLADMYPWVDVDEVDVTMLRRYLDREAANVRDGGRCSDATVAQKVTIVRVFFRWLFDEGYVPQDPSYRLRRPKLLSPVENDGVLTVSSDDVVRMLAACQDWRERICLNVLVYTGARRRAVANLRLSDYDATSDPPTLTFREKGGKTIAKPVPDRLARLLDQAFLDGAWDVQKTPDPWLIPPRGTTGWASRDEYGARRDDRIVWRTVKDVAERAGVHAHVHALRAAFAVLFLEQKPNQVVALKELMGHSKLETTQVYLRRLDRRRSMETVRDLDWGAGRSGGGETVSPDAEVDAAGRTATRPSFARTPRKTFASVREAEKEGFEPSKEADPAFTPSADLSADLLKAAREREALLAPIGTED